MEIVTLFIGGFLVGVVGAFLGIGGGVIIVPMLSVIFGYPVHEAVATSLAIVVANSLITSRQYLSAPSVRPAPSSAHGALSSKAKPSCGTRLRDSVASLVSRLSCPHPVGAGAKPASLVAEPASLVIEPRSGAANLDVALFIAMFSVMGALIGSSISLGLSSSVLYIALGSSQLLTIALMLTKKRFTGRLFDPNKSRGRFQASYYDGSSGKDVSYAMYNIPPTIGIAAFSGVLSGLVGVGGGVMIVPAMNIFSGMPMKAATATSAVIMGFTAASGGLIFFLHGLTHAATVMVMVPAIYIGSRLAVKAAVNVSGELVYRVFMVFLFLVACQMLYKGLA